MSIHINAQKGEIAPTVLLPGDPLRAKYIAENFLTDVKCYNQVRNMFGFTGKYKGHLVSVQGTGMGLPSLGIYVNELIDEYAADTLIRVGTCGSYQPYINLKDIIIPQAACSESNFTQRLFDGQSYAPIADFGLMAKAYEKCSELKCNVFVGNIYSSDQFYAANSEEWKKMAQYGVLGVEMESAMLFTLAAQKNIRAMSLLTVSDSLITSESTSSEEREKTFSQMVEVALELTL